MDPRYWTRLALQGRALGDLSVVSHAGTWTAHERLVVLATMHGWVSPGVWGWFQ